MNKQLNPTDPEHLRHDSMVAAWVEAYQREGAHQKHDDCSTCGWPHSPVTICGMGSVFGLLWLGGRKFYVDSSNVAYLRGFMNKLDALGFHWMNQRYFKREGDVVIVSFIEQFNGCPNLVQWTIPVNEFGSIVCAVSVGGETSERYQQISDFLSAAVLPPPQAETCPTCAKCFHPRDNHNMEGLGECYFNFGAHICQCDGFAADTPRQEKPIA